MPASTSQKNMNKEKEPIFRYWDQFNSVYSKNSDKFKSLSEFFNQYDKAKNAGNNPTLEQCIGRKDQNGELLFAGDIVQVEYEYRLGVCNDEIEIINRNPSKNHQPPEYTDISGHFIGVIRYQPSKGFVMSRVIEWLDYGDCADHPIKNDYKKRAGVMHFATSHTTKIGNINQHPYLIKEGIKQ